MFIMIILLQYIDDNNNIGSHLNGPFKQTSIIAIGELCKHNKDLVKRNFKELI